MATTNDNDRKRVASVRTALVLLSIALVFFGGIIFAQYAGEPSIGMGVLGFAVIGFLLVSIGRNLLRKDRRDSK
jgi:ABC-type uncharacterized transport system permease subunit